MLSNESVLLSSQKLKYPVFSIVTLWGRRVKLTNVIVTKQFENSLHRLCSVASYKEDCVAPWTPEAKE